MKRLAVFFLLCVFTAAAGRADDKLVDASKDAKSKRKKSTTKVITNKDVKKSKGTLIQTDAQQTKLPPVDAAKKKQEAAKRQQALNELQIAALEKQVTALTKDLNAIEQSYYDENDFKKRDTDIVRRFDETKRKLDQARYALAVLQGGEPAAPHRQ
jgi:hypothetical protein